MIENPYAVIRIYIILIFIHLQHYMKLYLSKLQVLVLDLKELFLNTTWILAVNSIMYFKGLLGYYECYISETTNYIF